ncbi:MAG: hypothetical protein ACOC2W_00890 [bacterium]
MIVDQKLKKSFVGVYLIDNDINGVQLATTKKPSKLNRFFAKLLLGWKWVSVSELKKIKLNGD